MVHRLLALVASVLLISYIAIVTVSDPAHASMTYDFVATTTSPSTHGSFSLQYVDSDEDGLFSLDELVPGSFTGMMAHVYYDGTAQWLPMETLMIVPMPFPENYYTDGKWTAHPIQYSWWIGEPYTTVMETFSDFTYSVTASAVPLPASVFLLGTGLIPLAWARRKKRLGK